MTIVSCLVACLALQAPADDLAAARKTLDAEHAAQLEKLAVKCEELGIKAEAERTRAWAVRRDAGRQYLFLVPDAEPIPLPPNAPMVVQQWHSALTRERQRFGDALLQHARDALAAGELERAYQAVHEVLRENPDQADARRILGFSRQGNRWTPDREPAFTRPKIAHGKLGWPGGSYSRIDSEHYRIATTAKKEAAVELARRLEELHGLWRQLHVRYWARPAALESWFQGPGPGWRAEKSQFNVVLFADKKQYVAALQQVHPQIAISEGIYIDADQTAYFYAGDASTEPTCFHEATHQLFHETRTVAPDVGGKTSFWVVEGAAMYMESLARHEGYYTVGGLDASRLQFARNWALSGGFHVPVADLVMKGRQPLQQDPDIRKIYTESAGLTHYLMDADGGRSRLALAAYLDRVYAGTDNAMTLTQLLAKPGPAIDRDYFNYLQVTDADLLAIRLLPGTRNLCLGRTGVTDAGLRQLGDLKRLEWLDLSFTMAGDASVARLAGLTSLTQLNLESTKITDLSLATLGKLTNLQELDLSQTPITDDGLKSLAGLKKLKTLWLTGTHITDKGLPSLVGLKELETLDVGQTGVTQPAWDRLKKQLPKVK